MPLYEYECDACGHRFEIIQKFSDPPLERCPKCGGAVHKLQSAPAFQFKGSGWYITDYSSKGKSGGESAAESKSDSKKTDAGSTDASSAKSASSSTTPSAKSSSET